MLAREKLPEVVAEVDRLSRERSEELDPAETKAVLAEVGLPGELLDEALVQIRLRDEARAAKKKRLVIAATIGALALGGVATVAVVRGRTTSAHGAIDVREAHLTDERAPGKEVDRVRRAEAPALRFAAELQHATTGDELSLACEWVAPSGSIAHHNTWKTKTIDHAPWLTHCRYTLPSTAETGPWHVRMTLEGRELSSREVTVE